MKVKELIGEVAKRHNVLVDPKDPIFVTITLNELLLAEYVQAVHDALRRGEISAAQAARTHIEASRKASEAIILEGGRGARDRLLKAGEAVAIHVHDVVRDLLATAKADVKETSHQRRVSQWAAVASIVAAFVACLCVLLLRHR